MHSSVIWLHSLSIRTPDVDDSIATLSIGH
jgi:hypothetical protein